MHHSPKPLLFAMRLMGPLRSDVLSVLCSRTHSKVGLLPDIADW